MTRSVKTILPGNIFLSLFIPFAILWGGFLIVGENVTNYTFFNELLFMFIIPIIFASLYYNRRIYLSVYSVSLFVSIWTIYCHALNTEHLISGLYTTITIFLFFLFTAEFTYRTVTFRRTIEEERERLIEELQQALSKVKTLSGLLPICACCKKIRNDKGYWEQIEWFIKDHSEAEFSHSLCPDCAKKIYPEYSDIMFEESNQSPSDTNV